MALEVGSVLEGKVTGIAKFGAFVGLPEGRSGLVHISEIANSYVNDVRDFVQVGQSVKVRVMNISPDGKINLSIKRAQEEPEGAEREPVRRPRQEQGRPAPAVPERAAESSGDQAFEDRLKKFMQESDSRIADNRRYAEHKQRNRRR